MKTKITSNNYEDSFRFKLAKSISLLEHFKNQLKFISLFFIIFQCTAVQVNAQQEGIQFENTSLSAVFEK